ncbi:DUF6612 family protein [Mediterraneibacter massiliensis]|uniref:DUF6612 family protein n=1 Tax=Mediterraneibacter massiliensis TaxID=1720300 RepID=UPI00073F05D5|nr:DUF6612 family protein [Mediterraneibacter massiliensis]
MKKYGKRVAATGMVAVMTATLLSGCGTKATPENLFKDMSENMKDIKSALCSMNVEASLTDGTDTMGIGMELDVEATKKPEAAHIEGDISIDFSGSSMSAQMEAYSIKEDDTYVSYSMIEDEWSKEEMDESEIDVLSENMFGGFEDMADDFELSEDLTDVEGEECFELKGEIKGESLNGLFDEEMMSSFGLDGVMDEDALEDVTIPCTVEVYKESILPARVNIDMKEVMESMMGETGEDVEVSDFYIEMTYVEYDKVKEIKVPDEAKEAVSGDAADDFDMDEDEGTDKKATPAKQSGKLGDSWDSYTVQINDTVLTLPCEMSELEALGLTLDTSYTPANYMVNTGEYELAYFMDENGNQIMVDALNTSGSALELKDCLVGGISVDDYGLENGGMTVIFPGGIQIGSTVEEVTAAYGACEDVYEGDYMDMYSWYAEDSYYNGCEIDFEAETGLVMSMYMDHHE